MFSLRGFTPFVLLIGLTLTVQTQQRSNLTLPGEECLVPCREIVSGGQPKDGIPAITDPVWMTVEESLDEGWPADDDLVLGVVRNGDARAMPLNILYWHEIVNETIGGERSVVSYCPLTGSGLHFAGQTASGMSDFGVSGRLRNNNLLLYNRAGDETWWSQILSTGITGAAMGEQLTRLPVVETTWEAWRTLRADTLVQSPRTGYARDYGRYPYGSYESLDRPPLFSMEDRYEDGRLPPKLRVLGITGTSGTRAYPVDEFDPVDAVNDVFQKTPILVVHDKEARLTLAYKRSVNGRILTFETHSDDTFPVTLYDTETGSTWTALGEAVSGPLAGTRLEPVTDSFVSFWFAWAAFFPDPEIYTRGSEQERSALSGSIWKRL